MNELEFNRLGWLRTAGHGAIDEMQCHQVPQGAGAASCGHHLQASSLLFFSARVLSFLINLDWLTDSSHIYCIDCANATELVKGPSAGRICPACRAPLNNLDDVVVTNLQPTEDYKTSVLSGLSPNIVMECAGKALSFWAYQMTQEMQVPNLFSHRTLLADDGR